MGELDFAPLKSIIDTGNKPLVIAGPCSAENERQVLETASLIKEAGVAQVFRAGVWKPRSRPGAYEGAGEVAFEWLKQVRAETGLLTAVEVANASHVEKALKHNADLLWLGARTTVNPFYVQEIAEALQGSNIPVMVKNPVNPDLNLWIGAIERIYASGINKIIAVHRGFSSYEKSQYRNAPQWHIPIELKARFPSLPVICDPSHICGNTTGLKKVAQKSFDLDMDGLMIETHVNPREALSDAEQQVTPQALKELVEGLCLRAVTSSNFEFKNKLEELRSRIDEIDIELLGAVQKRMEITELIGEYKRDNNITILQIERWKEILSTRTKHGKEIGLDEAFIQLLLNLLHKESIRLQTEVMNNKVEDV